MDQYYFIGYPEIYFSQEAQMNPNVTTLDVVLSFFFGVLLITILTLILEHWQKEESLKMEHPLL